jgi:hypothetical protein
MAGDGAHVLPAECCSGRVVAEHARSAASQRTTSTDAAPWLFLLGGIKTTTMLASSCSACFHHAAALRPGSSVLGQSSRLTQPRVLSQGHCVVARGNDAMRSGSLPAARRCRRFSPHRAHPGCSRRAHARSRAAVARRLQLASRFATHASRRARLPRARMRRLPPCRAPPAWRLPRASTRRLRPCAVRRL